MPTNINGFVVFGAIEAKWISIGGAGSPLGLPTGNEMPTFDGIGRNQLFEHGFMSWHPELGAFAVFGLIGVRWNELGREQFGYPITDETPTPDGIGRFNHFKAMHLDGRPESSIYWTPDTGAHEVFGAIRDKWAAGGWETGALGYPKNGEEVAFDGVGRFQVFQGGVASWHPELGAHVTWGLIGARWWDLGREQFGYPITDETPTPDGIGRFNHFKAMHLGGRPESSIYWTPDTGARAIFGDIRREWAELGWETGPLGYPVNEERDGPSGGRIQDFQSGTMSWMPARGARVDWVRMRRVVTTPPGTALGGWVELELHSDGNYKFRGHMHDSGFDSYDFRVRAAIASSGGVAIVAQKTGDVEGTSSGFSPRRDFDWDEAGFSPLMAVEWHDIDLRSFEVAKSYEDTGILGGLESVALDVLSFLIIDVALGPAAALVILIGNELSEISGTSVFGVGGVPGVLVLAGASFLVGPAMAIPIFVGAAVVTNALVKHRKLSQEEYDFADVVYQGTLPPIDKIIMTNLSGIGGRAFVAPNADGTVLLNISDEVFSFPGGPIVATHGDKYPVPGQVLIHELGHAWQLARNGFVPGYVCAGATSSTYKPPAPGSNWSTDFNIEQQATVVDQWFQRHSVSWNTMPGNRIENLRNLLSSEDAIRDPYFPYISRNIRMAEN